MVVIPHQSASGPVKMLAPGASCSTPKTNMQPNSIAKMAKRRQGPQHRTHHHVHADPADRYPSPADAGTATPRHTDVAALSTAPLPISKQPPPAQPSWLPQESCHPLVDHGRVHSPAIYTRICRDPGSG